MSDSESNDFKEDPKEDPKLKELNNKIKEFIPIPKRQIFLEKEPITITKKNMIFFIMVLIIFLLMMLIYYIYYSCVFNNNLDLSHLKYYYNS